MLENPQRELYCTTTPPTVHWTLQYSCVCFLLRNAKERILGLSRVSNAAGDFGKTDVLADDSMFEETLIAEYALVINGHSLVRYSTYSSTY